MASKAILPTIRKARSGDAESQFLLGRLYLDGGDGLPAHEATAYHWLSRAAVQGFAAAQQLIGARISPAAAGGDAAIVRWYELAASAGCVPAQAKLGRLLLERAARHQDGEALDRATALLRGAAIHGDADARYDLGIHLLTRSPDESALADARRFLEEAYEQGKRNAARVLADHYWHHRDVEAAKTWYGHCADLRDAESCFRMGMLNCMLGLPGADLLERAASEGHVSACEELGIRYAMGRAGGAGVRRLKSARRWLERAANLGSAKACFILAALYRHPTSSVRDREKARALLWKAASAGHIDAALETGLRIVRDLAAGRTSGGADVHGEEADVAAARFLSLAASAGYSAAGEALQQLAATPADSIDLDEGEWRKVLDAVGGKDTDLALRLSLGRSLRLATKELLLVDASSADRGDCFVIDLRALRLHRGRRVVLIEREDQRAIIDACKERLATRAKPADWRAEYRARYRRLRRLCRLAGVGAKLFPRSESYLRLRGFPRKEVSGRARAEA